MMPGRREPSFLLRHPLSLFSQRAFWTDPACTGDGFSRLPPHCEPLAVPLASPLLDTFSTVVWLDLATCWRRTSERTLSVGCAACSVPFSRGFTKVPRTTQESNSCQAQKRVAAME